ncbi:hypothetical protein CSPHI_10725 [Corynebacterium sphenisci DSM 44792]|uniref:DUF2975 domain-containing protein n=1 Tax=Corynebacterium sphenisci DSM 44792 TaxID=1437874 RepID=A0A1L7CZS1_9CORY|nr:hypothetical protein [Corynebacterium sphenisci]APT91386.1 hypothetical protein CSPHI_10725 [Corynebacterium sphenisci DSM 44792]
MHDEHTGPGTVADRRYPTPRSPRKERRDLTATAIALVLAVLLLLNYAAGPLLDGRGVPARAGTTPAQALLDGGRMVDRALIADSTATVLWTAHWAAVAILAALILCAAGLTRVFLRGGFFTLGCHRWLTALSWTLLLYLVAPGVLGMLGAGMVARDLGLDEPPGRSMEPGAFIACYVAVMTLSLVSVALRRAGALERDTEGLI